MSRRSMLTKKIIEQQKAQKQGIRWTEVPGWMCYDLPLIIEPMYVDRPVTQQEYARGLREVFGTEVTDEEAAQAWTRYQQWTAGTLPEQVAATAEWQARQK